MHIIFECVFLKFKHDAFFQEIIHCKRKIYKKLGGSMSYSLKSNCQYYQSLCVCFLIYKCRIFKLDQHCPMMRPHEGCKVRHRNIYMEKIFYIQKVQNFSMIYILDILTRSNFVKNKHVLVFDTEPTRILSRGVNLRLSVEVKEFVGLNRT